jgi:hypothetical protein
MFPMIVPCLLIQHFNIAFPFQLACFVLHCGVGIFTLNVRSRGCAIDDGESKLSKKINSEGTRRSVCKVIWPFL